MPGLGIVMNPYSGHNRRNPDGMKKMAYIIGDKGTCERTKSVDHVSQVAEDFKRHGIDALCISGGDGTNHVTLTAFLNVYGDMPLPPVAFLRGGTMNTQADSCGIKGTPVSILHNIVEKYHRREEFKMQERDLLKVDGRYGFIFGSGLVYNFLEYYYAGELPSVKKAVRTFCTVVGSAVVGGPLARKLAEPVDVTVSADGAVWECRRFIALVASTIESLGLQFRMFNRAEEMPGTFHLIGADTTAMGVVRELWNVRMGRPLRRDRFIEAVCREAVFKPNRPMGYTIDGDLYVAEGELRMTVGPRLKLIVN